MHVQRGFFAEGVLHFAQFVWCCKDHSKSDLFIGNGYAVGAGIVIPGVTGILDDKSKKSRSDISPHGSRSVKSRWTAGVNKVSADFHKMRLIGAVFG